ncbi:hypothetical protein ACF0H5_022684 [Mactra antiquata]
MKRIRVKSKNILLLCVGLVTILGTIVILSHDHALRIDIKRVINEFVDENISQNGSGYYDHITITDKMIEQRFKDRRTQLEDACQRYKGDNAKLMRPCNRKLTGFNLKYVNGSDVLYCAIEKTGSTFWKRILHIVGGWGNDSNPTSIRSKDADAKNGGFTTFDDYAWKRMISKVSESDSIMFVRDPYTRLFSAWLDKFYNPNHYYWSTLGPLILKSERPYLEKIPKCAHDITFVEFINFIIKEVNRNPCLDGHFAPNYDHCFPCKMSYDYIGKYETLKEDTFHILNALNLSSLVTFNDFEDDAVWDAVRDSGEFVFMNREKLEDCGIPFKCVLFKVWKRMQSRGILSTNIPFPFQGNESVANITEDEFTTSVIQASHASNPKEIRNNRKEALEQAYQSIPLRAVSQLVEAFEVDFDLFGYDRYPNFVKIMSSSSSREYFEQCPKF